MESTIYDWSIVNATWQRCIMCSWHSQCPRSPWRGLFQAYSPISTKLPTARKTPHHWTNANVTATKIVSGNITEHNLVDEIGRSSLGRTIVLTSDEGVRPVIVLYGLNTSDSNHVSSNWDSLSLEKVLSLPLSQIMCLEQPRASSPPFAKG